MSRTATDHSAAIDTLAAHFGDRFDRSRPVRDLHGRDESWHDGAPPDGVVFAASTDDVATVVRTCAEHGVPVIPFGAGTSLEGHVAALEGGICIDLSRMDRILEVNHEDLDCRVQAGVRRRQLDTRLRRDGLFFPIDPGADATMGGMVSTRASGTTAVRYGTMRDNVLGLTVVLADGSVTRTGTRARKSSAGYDLTRLFVGAEGTLGVITEVSLRLQGTPEVTGAAICSFPSVDSAVRTAIQTIQLGVPVARIELIDEVQVEACNQYSQLGLPDRPHLLLEFHGSPAAVAADADTVERLAVGHGADGWEWSTDPGVRRRLWRARHEAYYAALALRPGTKGVVTDVCVPISRLADCIEQTRADLEASRLTAPIAGHVGDGNFHLLLLFDPDDPDEQERAMALHGRLVRRALSMGGTCTGEHGIGFGKLGFMTEEHDEESLAAMRRVKHALDPDGIMNPGKVVPADGAT